MMKKIFWIGLLALNVAAETALGAVLYRNDLEKTPVGQVPSDFLILDGQFSVQSSGTNKFLALPGAPLDTFGVLFGPSRKENTAVKARIYGTKRGPRFPVFAVGLNGWGGYRLQVAPAKRDLELLKGDVVEKSIPWRWVSGHWTWMELQIVKVKAGGWKAQGKAWTQGQPAPKNWLVEWDERDEPRAGRASIVGSPFSGLPIRYDDLEVDSENPEEP